MNISYNIGSAIKNVLQECIDKKMPVKTSYKIMKIIKAIEEEEVFFANKMQEIINEYGEKDENGNYIQTGENSIKIKDGKIEECNAKINELNSIEIKIPDYKISLDELELIELSPKELYLLDSIIE